MVMFLPDVLPLLCSCLHSDCVLVVACVCACVRACVCVSVFDNSVVKI